MARMWLILAVAAFGSAEALASHKSEAQVLANPVRKVVTLLQQMQAKVTKEGEQEKELYEKFMCYCKTSGGDLSASIEEAEAKGPQVTSGIEAAEGKLKQLKEELKKAQVDRSAAKDAMAQATALREKEAAAFAAEKAEMDTNIAAMKKAVAALEKGMAGAFLQTGEAQVLKRLVLSKQDMLDADRQDLVAFLSSNTDYAPSSGEITGILKQMLETMEKGLVEATSEEEGAIKAYDGLMAAKSKEVEALTAAIETKTKRIGELGVEIVTMKEDLDDTTEQLEADEKFIAELEKGCKTKTAEWEERSKTRAEELVALADTIKVLNDDDALDLFKKTLPSASSSFVQVSQSSAALRQQAMAVIKQARSVVDKKDRRGLDLLVLALAGKRSLAQGGFDKVIKMIDNMVKVLKEEQLDDDHKKEYCEAQFDQADDKKKALEREVSDSEHEIETCKEGIATLTEEIAALEDKIKALDKDVAEQTEQRKEENEEYKALMASDTAAKELLGFAKNRLNKFYNPKLYKAPPKQELSSEDRIAVNMGSMEAPTVAPSGIAGTGVTVFAQIRAHVQNEEDDSAAPPPPPATWDAYAKKSEESTGVISMIDMLVADLEKEMTEAKTGEKNGQADYEAFMEDCALTRTTDSKALADKGAAKAELEGNLEAAKSSKEAATKELMGVLKYIASLHSECDWLLQYYEVRKEARAGEVDALIKAKAVLSGADYSLLQTRGLRVRMN